MFATWSFGAAEVSDTITYPVCLDQEDLNESELQRRVYQDYHDWILTEFDNMDEATARFRVRLLLEFDKQDVGIEQTGLFVEIISVMLSLPEPQPVRDKHTFSGRNFDGSWDLLQQSILFWKYQNYPLTGNCKMMLMLTNMYVVTDKSPKHNDQQTVIFLSNMQSAQM